MKLKDLVANSLPRVRGRKSKKSAHAHSIPTHSSGNQKPDISTCPRYFPNHYQHHQHQQQQYFHQYQRMGPDSRESSVERSSTVAVVDAPWRENAAYTGSVGRSYTHRPGDSTQALTYYTPPPPPKHGMVMSHSADAISSHATMAVLMTSSSQGYHHPHHQHQGSKVTSSRPIDPYGSCSSGSGGADYQHHISAISENAVNYIGPNCFYHTQHQHQHHHHHNHNHHYVYHHHHHRLHQNNLQSQYPPRPAPLAENNHQISEAPIAGAEKPKKSSSSAGFLRKSFASFRAMRKQGCRSKEQETRPSTSPDENDKCQVCPYPEFQGVDKAGSDRKSGKQSRKGLKGLTKSKKKKTSSSAQLLDHHSGDKSWYSDNDTHKVHPSFSYNTDALPYPNFRQFPVRECSMQGPIPRHDSAPRSWESSCIRDMEGQGQETVSLSGYDSDATKNRTSRSRSRIKTNPWLPSPQPSLTMGRRFGNGQPREGTEDAMDEDMPSSFPRSASFDYHSQLGLTSSFQSPLTLDESKRVIQRHRSLTPVDLKLNLSLPMTRSSYAQLGEQTGSLKNQKETGKVKPDKNILNDLNSNPSKSRPSSIVSPNAEFMTLADNIEQLANNISFEYEDVSPTPTGGGVTPIKDGTAVKEEKATKKRRSESDEFPSDNVSDNAHSPDSGIACLGSCDGDESLTLSSSAMLEVSPTFETRSSTPGSALDMDALHGTFPRTSSPCRTTARKTSRNSTPFATSPESDRESNSQQSTQMAASSSNESLNSGVISESDIDNTSYRYVDTSPQAFVETDFSKPLNFHGSLMVEERLDVDFQSLPRRVSGKLGRKVGQNGVSRYHTLASIHSDMDYSFMTRGGKNKSKTDHHTSIATSNRQDMVLDREGHMSLSDKEGDILVPKFPISEHQHGLSVVDNGLDPSIALVVSLDGIRSLQASDESVKGLDTGKGACREGLEPPLGFRDAGKIEAALLSTQGDASGHPATEINSFETVDACVQTDFYDDFDTWERRQPYNLPHLDDSFDPVESTRRWLLSGNMQGSADTGYSSQARDSHVFMDDETPAFESKGGTGNDWSGKDTICLEANVSTSRQGTTKVTPCHLFPGTMSPCLTTISDKVKVRTRPTGSNSDDTKRHSSDSSTSTLTSDLPGAPDSGLEEASSKIHPQKVHNSCATKSIAEEPDYVNMPSHALNNISSLKALPVTSTAQGALKGKPLKFSNGENTETKRKCKKSFSPPHPYILPLDSQDYTESANDAVSEGKIIDTGLGSFQRVESMSLIDPDTADYLEFLRDAPLSSERSKTPVFIIPGFGPIELTFELSESCLDLARPRDKYSSAASAQTLGNSEDVTKRSRKSSHYYQAHTVSETPATPSCCSCKVKKASKSKTELVTSSSQKQAHADQFEVSKDSKGHYCHHVHSGKRKTTTNSHGNKDFKTSRCPTMRSYDVDGFALTSTDAVSPNPSNAPNPGVKPMASVSDAGVKHTSSSSARSVLAERVAHLRLEKELIYKKIQEVQEQELSRQREQLQHQRHLHSQRKEELLETLQDLKENLEEQNRKLQLKCAEESNNN